MGIWQFIAGGGEDAETPLTAAVRESYEEAGIPTDLSYFELTTKTHVPVSCFSSDAQKSWGDTTFVIPVHCFAVEVPSHEIVLSDEHKRYQWEGYDTAKNMLHFDVDRTALWELSRRLK
jgi:dATP pyrophosphohydrolase